ncbi:Gfo/Idh/MocA family protein [Paenibacillus sp. IITD108]|uniref:Gfo/Idh/MocA family protein n=1 Tax=Paenibacillus sp. IITD108 TaxID=3116649 RepID=UPI002F417749
MEKLKFAIIGCEHGHISIFMEEMQQLGHEGIGIYEPRNHELAAAMSEKYNIPIIDDAEQLIQEADIVGSAAINNEKIDIVERCERAGKPIMIDKPAVTNRRDFERLKAVIERGKIEVGMLLTERFHPAIYTLKHKIDQGLLGDIVTISMRKPHLLNPDKRPSWFFSKEQCGGILIDLLIHDYDLLRWFTDTEIVKTQGNMTKRLLPEHPGFYDTVSVQVVMEGGVTAQLYADWYTPGKSWTWGDGRICVTGTEGFAELRLAGDPFVEKESLFLCTTNSEEPAKVELTETSASISGDFINRIRGEQFLLSSEDILAATLATIEADEQIEIINIKEGVRI